MKIFLTGGMGFIGRYFLRGAVNAGHEIVALVQSGSDTTWWEGQQVKWIYGELDDDVRAALSGCEVLVHLAAFGVPPKPGCNDWDQCMRWNVTASLKLWRLAIDVGVKRLMVCGSCVEYGRAADHYDLVPPDAPLEPNGAYATSKAAASVAAIGLAQERQFELILLRFFNVYGEGQYAFNFWPTLKRAALAGEDFPMTPGNQVRDFISVEETVSVMIRELVRGPEGGRITMKNVGTGHPQTLLQFTQYWWTRWAAKGKLLPGAIPYRPGEVMRYAPLIT